jgi:hypothetical protein
MGFGKMNEFIDIIESIPTKDSDGFSSFSDTILASVRAYKEDRHGNVQWANRAAFSAATCLFRFRVIPSLKIIPSLYIACLGERYRIVSAEDVRGRGMYIEVLTEKLEAVKGGEI